MANYTPSPTIQRVRKLNTAVHALFEYDATPEMVTSKAEGCAPVRGAELQATARILREAAEHLDRLAESFN